MENSTPCIVTPENFILKLGTRDYVNKSGTAVHVWACTGTTVNISLLHLQAPAARW